MGDRVSVQFRLTDSENERSSVVLFNHWGGKYFARKAYKYAVKLRTQTAGAGLPLGRFEPETVMVDYIREVTKDQDRVRKDLYLGASTADGDNSDNGHYVVWLKKGKIRVFRQYKDECLNEVDPDGAELNEATKVA